MPMSPRLLRPRSTVHPEANSWAARVTASGGTFSSSTLAAVSRFCQDIDAAGIRDRFFRLNLICGNSDGSLIAVRTPLYLAESRTAAVMGNALDTNVNFVPGDYAETGASAGLQGLAASTKHLNTGLLGSVVSRQSSHCCFYGDSLHLPAATNVILIGARDASAQNLFQLQGRTSNSNGNRYFASSAPSAPAVDGSPLISAGMLLGSSVSRTDLRMFANGVQTGLQTGDRSDAAGPTSAFFVFAGSGAGVVVGGEISSARCRAYSIGPGMTGTQVASYYAAMQRFQSALGRAL
jgi:hypothetical protein